MPIVETVIEAYDEPIFVVAGRVATFSPRRQQQYSNSPKCLWVWKCKSKFAPI
jgi:hypothetical protein